MYRKENKSNALKQKIVVEFNFMGMHLKCIRQMGERQKIEPTEYEILLHWPFGAVSITVIVAHEVNWFSTSFRKSQWIGLHVYPHYPQSCII